MVDLPTCLEQLRSENLGVSSKNRCCQGSAVKPCTRKRCEGSSAQANSVCGFIHQGYYPRVCWVQMGLRLLLLFSFFFLLSLFSLFSFFSLLPTLFPLGRGPFASLARGQPSPFAFVILANAGIHSWFSFYAFPCHSVANVSSFFLFIDACVFEDRAVAMGKPHCNRSICTFRLCTALLLPGP